MRLDLLSLGGALVDLILPVNFSLLRRFGLKKGHSLERLNLSHQEILNESVLRPLMISGGSANNVTKAAAGFGLKCAFVRKVGIDDLGFFFLKSILNFNILPLLCQESQKETGQTLVLLTPDGDRTMCPKLGASLEIKSSEVALYLKN